MRIITIAYFALVPAEELASALAEHTDLMLAPLAALPPLAFDHAVIVDHATARLRGKLDYAPVAFALLPMLFTLRALQDVHEAILGTPLNKPALPAAYARHRLDRRHR